MSKWKIVGCVSTGDENKLNSQLKPFQNEIPILSFRQSVKKVSFYDSASNIPEKKKYPAKTNNSIIKESAVNRSFSRFKTDRSLANSKINVNKSSNSKQKLFNEDNDFSRCSLDDLAQKPKKLHQFPKQNQLKLLKEDQNRLKEFVKYEINSFKSAFKNLEAELRFEINYKKKIQAQRAELHVKGPGQATGEQNDRKYLQITKYGTDKTDKNTSLLEQPGDIMLKTIREEANLYMQSLREFETQRAQILQKFKDINLEELLA